MNWIIRKGLKLFFIVACAMLFTFSFAKLDEDRRIEKAEKYQRRLVKEKKRAVKHYKYWLKTTGNPKNITVKEWYEFVYLKGYTPFATEKEQHNRRRSRNNGDEELAVYGMYKAMGN